MPIYSYRCPEGHEYEELVPMADRMEQPCPECGVTGNLRITPVALDYLGMGVDPGFPTAADKWDKSHQKQKEREEKTYGEHGDYGSAPGA